MNKNWKKYFEKASSHFLISEMSYEEFEQVLDTGGILPTQDAYSDWDVDFLENAIKDLADTVATMMDEVTKTLDRNDELNNAIGYFEQGFLEELTTDKQHYVKVLLEHAKKASDETKPKSINIVFSAEDLSVMSGQYEDGEKEPIHVFTWTYEGIDILIGVGEELDNES